MGQPILDAKYVPTHTDTVARGRGANLSSFFTTDMSGSARPATGGWDIGAYQSLARPQPPTGVSVKN
jgi:hypothetical protein